MSRTKSLFSATAIVMGASAALLTGGIAQADPAPAPSPAGPGLNMIQQLMDPAKAPQFLQAATAILTGLNSAPPATAAIPAAAPSLATATVNLPQTPGALPLPGMPTAALPGMPASTLPGMPTSTLPGMPAAPLPGMPATTPLSAAVPPAAGLSTIPGLPVPLPANLPFPTDLSALLPAAGIPAPNLSGTPAAAPAAAPSLSIPSLFPTSALSALP
jgi:hypothetical protein